MFSSDRIIKNESLFMEDGATCHTAKDTHDWLLQDRIKKLLWPNESPYMNPIDHPWAILE